MPNSSPSAWQAKLGKQIKEARKERKYPQQKLAKALGVCSETLRQYEAGKISLPLEALRTIVHELRATFQLDGITISASSFPPIRPTDTAEQTAFEFHNDYKYVGMTVRMSVTKEGFELTGYEPAKAANG